MTNWSPFGSVPQSGSDDWSPVPAEAFNADLRRTHPRYHVVRLLGYGGMGAVYAARDTESARPVAIKMLRPDLHSPDPRDAYVVRFKRESDHLRRLRHRNIVNVHDAGETSDGYHFFVMDLLEGESLASVLARPTRLPLSRIVRMMYDVCAGMQHAHEQEIVHRDLKASNVFIVRDDGRAVVLDFGIAREFTARTNSFSKGRVQGTDGHIAPEVWEGRPARSPADVFSLGVVFLHMLIGSVPMVGHDSPSGYGFDPRLDEVVRRALHHDPAARYQRVADFADALQRVTALESVAPVSAPLGRGAAVPAAALTVPAVPVAAPVAIDLASPGLPAITPLVPASAARLVQHRQFFESLSPPSRPQRKNSIPVTHGEEWEVIDQWDAYPEIPPGETIVRRLAMRQRVSEIAVLAGSVIVLARAISITSGYPDSWGERIGSVLILWLIGTIFVGWAFYRASRWVFDLVTKSRSDSDPSWEQDPMFGEYMSKVGEEEEQAAWFNPRQLWWHPHHPHLFVTRDHYQLASWEWREEHDGGGHRVMRRQMARVRKLFEAGEVKASMFGEDAFMTRSESFWWWRFLSGTDHWTIYDQWGYERFLLTKASRYPEPFGDLRSNPFRPNRSHGDEFLVRIERKVMGICALESLPKRLYRNVGDRVELPAISLIDLSHVELSDADNVTSFAWHPTGFYLAIVVGGALHLIHWDSAELIASQRPGGSSVEAAGWNPEGTLVALDASQTRVWDVHANTIRTPKDDERWRSEGRGTEEDKLISCDGLRRFNFPYGGKVDTNNFNPALTRLADVAWSPHDPNLLATLGGAECPRAIRIWRLVPAR